MTASLRRPSLSASFRAFDAAEELAREAGASWEPVKERSTAALKNGDNLGAARLYRQAAQLALGPLEGESKQASKTTLEATFAVRTLC